ncbi:hypothetical protein [Specibacter sp. NPDC078692]|uniref:hypothetical protein n=1 Tax=Specibacter sp. NPDC078692 TaxID=3155818 RepID=UPI003415D283
MCEWFRAQSRTRGSAAAADTQFGGASLVAGRASKAADSHLDQTGSAMVAPPGCLPVTDRETIMLSGEVTCAQPAGGNLAAQASKTIGKAPAS